MTNIRREYVTPYVISVRDKLDKNLTSFLNFYECKVYSCNFVEI